MQIHLVNFVEWTAMYINYRLVLEGASLRPHNILRAIQDFQYDLDDEDCRIEHLVVAIPTRKFQEKVGLDGYCPLTLNKDLVLHP